MSISDLDLASVAGIAAIQARQDAFEREVSRLRADTALVHRLEERIRHNAARIEEHDERLGRSQTVGATNANSVEMLKVSTERLDRRSARTLRVMEEATSAIKAHRSQVDSTIAAVASVSDTLAKVGQRLDAVETININHTWKWKILWLVAAAVGGLAGAVLAAVAGAGIKHALGL